ncbi:hypothetical protein LSCM4_08077 [Leishmania orientalis]|uniref:Tyrosine-protein phosphatase domain-containing protein n=1 Tax=Leishmania orientalis TaxID=2249476 RepID=A0A836GT05_9TRYP|nr:hypothetical protein LSCM4_08077 [Leishmania orientalis]
MPATPPQHQSPSKQRLHRREDSGYAGSQTSSPFVCAPPSSPLPASGSATAATSGSAGSDRSARSSDRGDDVEVISAASGDVDDGGGNGGSDSTSAWLKSKRRGQKQRCSCHDSRMSPRIASARKAKISNGMCPSTSDSGLDRAAAAAIVTSSTSSADPLQAPVVSTSAAPGVHFTGCSPSSSRSRSNTNSSEVDMQSSKSGGGGGLATVQAAPESELSSPAVWLSDCSGGGSGTMLLLQVSSDDVRQPANGCEHEATADLSGESASRGHVSSLPRTGTATASITPLAYTAVAPSSLHGKRLPRSRVGFSQWRQRVYSGSASAPSTIGRANVTSVTATDTIEYASAAVSLNSTSLSTPQTLTIPSTTTTANPSRVTGETAPISLSFVDNESSVADGGGKASFASGGEHDGISGVPQHTSVDVMMPPLPPSVHRHQPTHLILRLPNASQSQQAPNGLDTDEGVICDSSPRTTGPHGTTAAATAVVARSSGLRITAIASANSPAPSLPFSASEVTPATSVHTLSSPAGTQLPHPTILRPFTTMSFAAFSPTTSARGGAIGGIHPKGPAIATATAGKATHRTSSTASAFNAVEILPGLFLGSYADATDTEALAANGVSLVINCTVECPVTSAMANNSHHVRYVQCPLRDHSDEAIAPFFTPVTRVIHEQLHRRQLSRLRMARRATANAPTVEVNDTEERLLWAWADEAENIWAVRTSPVSTPLSVGGQPSFKESKRETPRTPLSAPGLGARFGEGARCSSTTTSCSPSPMPGRTATFPLLAPTAAGSADVSSAMQNTNNVSASMPLITPPQLFGSTALEVPANPTVATAPPPEASPLTPLASAMTSFAASASSPLTIVDPRDCGGVLVCCRMGVSRSASFIIAYLILYGYTLAPLEDTASLFVYFLERERRIIEEAGGVTSFTDHNNDDVSATTSPTTAAVPARWGRGGGDGQGLAPPAGAPPSRRGSASAPGGQSPPQQTFPANTSWQRKRPAAIPVASPLTFSGSCFGGECPAGILATPLSVNASFSSQQQRFCAASPPTAIEFASRVCQPCWLMRLRERRLQQQPQRQVLISGQQQQQREQRDAEQQVKALSTTCMSVRESGQGRGLPSCVDADSNVDGSRGTTTSGGDDIAHSDAQQHHFYCRAFSAFPSSAPVASHRSARRSCTVTLLEAAYADEQVTDGDGVEEEAQQQQISEATRTSQGDGARMNDRQKRSEGFDSVIAITPIVKSAAKSLRNSVTAHKACVVGAEDASTALDHSAATDARRGHGKNEYGVHSSFREQQLTPLRSPYVPLSPQPPMNGSAHGDLNTSLNALLGVSFASSGGNNASAFGCAAPAMTYRDAFDAVKQQKADVNPNIGFVLALRELAGGGDFSLSASL